MTANAWPVTPLWSAVTTRDGQRCTCHGRCGRRHFRRQPGKPLPADGSPATRCDVAVPPGRPFVPGVRLVVAPADPTLPETAAAHLPAGELATWCRECLRHAGTAARVEVENPTLF